MQSLPDSAESNDWDIAFSVFYADDIGSVKSCFKSELFLADAFCLAKLIKRVCIIGAMCACFGIVESNAREVDFGEFCLYLLFVADENDFANAFLDDMPFVPLCYRAGLAAYSRSIAPDFSAAAYDIYGDITLWTAA